MHPIERLRMVARVTDVPAAVAAREAALALAAVAEEPAALVTACRRLVESQPAVGLLWWLSARILVAPDPVEEAYRTIDELDRDPTRDHLVAELPVGARVSAPDPGGLVRAALDLRPDARVCAAGDDDADDGCDDGHADLVLVEAAAAGPGGLLAAAGTAEAIGAAPRAGVVGVVGLGRALPAELWAALLALVEGDPGYAVVAPGFFEAVVGPEGRTDPGVLASRADCLPVPDLTRWRGSSHREGW